MTPPLVRGEFVFVTAQGKTLRAMIGMASPHGRSVILLFDGTLPGASGAWLGTVPAYEDAAGNWSALDETPLQISRRCRDYRPDHNGECTNCDERHPDDDGGEP